MSAFWHLQGTAFTPAFFQFMMVSVIGYARCFADLGKSQSIWKIRGGLHHSQASQSIVKMLIPIHDSPSDCGDMPGIACEGESWTGISIFKLD
jgi:hypothetical protein